MSDFIPKPNTQKIGGLGPKAARLQALREKAAGLNKDAKSTQGASGPSAKAGNAPPKKTAFQRKAT
jgi:hypothetical protein